MSLTYYRMPYFVAAFFLVWIMVVGVTALTKSETDSKEDYSGKSQSESQLQLDGFLGIRSSWIASFLLNLMLVGLGTLIFALAWLPRLVGGKLMSVVSAGVTQTMPLAGILRDYRIWQDIAFYVPLELLVLVGISILWGVLSRDRLIFVYALWVLGLGSLVATRLVNLPGSNVMQNFAVLIALYIPVSLIISGSTGQLLGHISKIQGIWGQMLSLFIVLAIGFGFGVSQLSLVDHAFVMMTRPDTRAMTWIRSNVPEDARFLVEGFPIWGGASAVGSDAGWWIPVMAGRKNTMPPQYALLNEQPGTPGYPERVVSLIERLARVRPASDRGIQALCEFGVTHIFIGQTQGRTSMGMPQLYGPEDFEDQNGFEEIYHRDRVRIYQLVSSLCDQ